MLIDTETRKEVILEDGIHYIENNEVIKGIILVAKSKVWRWYDSYEKYLDDIIHTNLPSIAFKETKCKQLKEEIHEAREELFHPQRYGRKADYHKYLASNEWKAKRKEKLALNSICEICGSDKEIQIHHLNYNNVGSEQMDDLQTLCKKCHYKTHFKDGVKR